MPERPKGSPAVAAWRAACPSHKMKVGWQEVLEQPLKFDQFLTNLLKSEAL